jgi:hypothetical protein
MSIEPISASGVGLRETKTGLRHDPTLFLGYAERDAQEKYLLQTTIPFCMLEYLCERVDGTAFCARD